VAVAVAVAGQLAARLVVYGEDRRLLQTRLASGLHVEHLHLVRGLTVRPNLLRRGPGPRWGESSAWVTTRSYPG
jgi:hypothetical protein